MIPQVGNFTMKVAVKFLWTHKKIGLFKMFETWPAKFNPLTVFA